MARIRGRMRPGGVDIDVAEGFLSNRGAMGRRDVHRIVLLVLVTILVSRNQQGDILYHNTYVFRVYK